MQWILTICSCIGILIRLTKCQPTIRPFATKPLKWEKGHAELVYPQLHKIKSSSPDTPPVLILRNNIETFYIELVPNSLLKPNVTGEMGFNSSQSCHYHGNVLSHVGGMAAISLCEPRNRMTGTIMVRNEAFILRPLDHLEGKESFQDLRNISDTGSDPHVISKVEDSLGQYCGVDADEVGVQLEENGIPSSRFRRSAAEPDHKVIETAIYVDYPLYRKFTEERRRSESQLKDTILAIINQVQIIYNYQSLNIKFKIIVVKLEFLMKGKEAPDPADGDIDDYLDNFCLWQSRRNPPESSDQHWDHALMLTGYDLHKITNGKKNKKVLGLAWVNGMCRPKHSCTLNEGSSFEAAFVIAHEMGHSLGMLHDGRGNNCDPSAYLMSEKTGPGRTTWSTCSNDYLEKFFERGRGSCLVDDDSNAVGSGQYKFDDQLPGLRFDLDDQCKMSLGNDYRPHVMSKPPFNNVCRELWCVSGLWASVAHPALEGSSCDGEKQCIQGKCKGRRSVPKKNENSIMDVHKMVADFMDRLKLVFEFMLP